MFKLQAPVFLQHPFTFVNHGSTRAEASRKVNIPKSNVELSKACLTCQRPKSWNNLPNDLTNYSSADTLNSVQKFFRFYM